MLKMYDFWDLLRFECYRLNLGFFSPDIRREPNPNKFFLTHRRDVVRFRIKVECLGGVGVVFDTVVGEEE